jgi:HK97 family phage portal protein
MAGLIEKVTSTVLTHYGLVRQSTLTVPRGDTPAPDAPGPPAASGVTQKLGLYQPWAMGTNTTGLSPTKNPNEMLNSYRSWAYSCVRVIGQRLAALPLQLVLNTRMADATDVERVEVLDHAFLDMMWSPNPWDTRAELWITTVNHLELCGNAYWLLLNDKLGIPREIWPLYPQYMRVVPDKVNFIGGYVYTVTQPAIRFDIDNREYKIVHFKYPNPKNPYYGVGALEAQAMAYDLDMYMQVYQRSFFQEGARPDFVFETDQEITKETAQLTWELWDERHKGVTKAWRPGILGSGMKAKPLNVSNRDLTFAALADYTRDLFLGAFGVPAAKLGLVVDANRANADAADYTFNKETIYPKCLIIEERIEKSVLPFYPGQGPGLWFETDFENPVPEDEELKMKKRATNLEHGVTVINEERADDGKEPVPWGDKPWLPSTLTQLGELPETPTEPPDPSVPPEEPATPDDDPVDVPGDEEPATDTLVTSEDTEAFRTRIWTAHIMRVAPLETRFEGIVQQLFTTQEGLVLDALAANFKALDAYFTGWSAKKIAAHLKDNDIASLHSITMTIANDSKQWISPVTGQIRSAVSQAGAHAVASVGIGTWTLDDPVIIEWIQQQGAKAVAHTTETTQQAIRSQLIEGITAGEGIGPLASRVRDVYAEATSTRSKTIARTETHTATNYGTDQGYRKSGIVTEKEWLTARDERVRTSHAALDGTSIPMNGHFHAGKGEGPAPGQMNRAEEDINCRCTLLAHTGSGPVIKPSVAKQPTVTPITTIEGMRMFLDKRVAELIPIMGDPSASIGKPWWDQEVSKRASTLLQTMGGVDRAALGKKMPLAQIGIFPEDLPRAKEQHARLLDIVGGAMNDKALAKIPRVAELGMSLEERGGYYTAENIGVPGHNRGYMKSVYRAKNTTAGFQDLTLIHEWLHHVEYETPGVRDAAQLFYQSRTAGEPAVLLSQLVPGSGYKDTEYGRKDKWYHMYQGKVPYPDGCTEMLTMSGQEFRSPSRMAELWQTDPHSFAFAHTVLTGGTFTEEA